jgi:alcohol oxidase
MPSYRGEHALLHPRFPEGSAAACVRLNGPPEEVEDIVYSPDDNAAVEAYVRQNTDITPHFVSIVQGDCGI